MELRLLRIDKCSTISMPSAAVSLCISLLVASVLKRPLDFLTIMMWGFLALSLCHWWLGGSSRHHPSLNRFGCYQCYQCYLLRSFHAISFMLQFLLLVVSVSPLLVHFHLQCICQVQRIAAPQASVAATASSCLTWASPFGTSIYTSNIVWVKNRWGRGKNLCTKRST